MPAQFVLSRAAFVELLAALRAQGYRLMGPTVRDGAIVYDELSGVDDLPIGWTDEQDGGTYRLTRRDDAALFGYTVGPHSWKQVFHPPAVKLWRAVRDERGLRLEAEPLPAAKTALIGARACDLHAIAIQDTTFLHGPVVDRRYEAARRDTFVVAIQCGQAARTCFCASMGTGPRASAGFDLALTEVLDERGHRFVGEAGTPAGEAVLARLPHRPAAPEDLEAAAQRHDAALAQMGRRLDAGGVRELLQENLDHPRWDEVASRCLACGNCTMVCPTCFCTATSDRGDLAGREAERWQTWDSCFTMDFSYVHGGSVRRSTKSRYRQWLTHKLSTWFDQFGRSGCVGCGRCITWCPVGIDLTEEVRAIRETPSRPGPAAEPSHGHP
ncbi:MAG: 4Fe-4S dicluster domain-containing protein [Acidobacteriota bacterium]|nr:4Fe-4S dicluster domain-containing protein [Acidobacteriota bacterium]